jgi:predicted transcriptional regulator
MMLKEETVMVMNSKEKRMEELLLKYGFCHSKARCMIYMLEIGSGTSKEIESVMDLRQPEVSTSMKELYQEKMVDITTRQIADTKGRPEKIYQLAKRKEMIVASIEKKMNDKAAKIVRKMEELKKILTK